MEKTIEGLVKGVLSGDQVIISGKMKKNSEEAPEEKQFYLSLLNAPRSGNSNNLEEEAFSWDARDFLRQKVLGKVVKYTQDYRNNDRQYGQLYIDGVNINLDLVRNGLAKVGFIPKNEAIGKSEYLTKLQAAEAEAKKAKLGMWTTDQAVIAQHKRKLQSSTDPLFDVQDVMKLAKQGELDVVVDYVINCAVYSVFVKSLNAYIKLSLRFVAIPNARDQIIYKAGKSYVERLILHKDIKAVIHSVDGDRTFLGDLIDKKGSIAGFILKNGYSKLFINNSTPYTTDELNAMKDAQMQGKKDKLRIWKNEKDEEGEDGDRGFSVGKEKKEKTSKVEFSAIVQQIHSGDSLSVKNVSNNEVSRIFLSHMKAPKFGKPNTEEQDQPWAFQAKEFMRKILVGKKIRAEHDYSKTLDDGKKMNFYSIFRFVDSKEKDKKSTDPATEKNVNVEILEGGYASYIPPNPKLDDDVSKYLDSYQAAAQVSKEKKSGVNSTKFPGNSNYSDLIAANKTKKKEFINFLVNQKGLQCVVEYCFSGSKFKLRIEKNKCHIPFSLLGVKTFGKDINTLELHDKFFREAQDFANDTILQREGTCDIIQADKVGNYFGYLTINGVNYGTTIIKEGLAVPSAGQSNAPIIHMNDFKAAEKSAEQQSKGIFAYPNLASFLKEGELTNSTLPKGFEEKHSDIKLRITDYIDFNNFYINILPNKNLNKIDSTLEGYNSGSVKGTPLEFPVKMNTLCAAKYSADGNYYRAKITKALKDEKYEVELLDFGTLDTVYKSDLIKLDNSIAMIEPQAVLCELAYLKYSQNSMKNALNKITDFVNLEAELPGKFCYSYADSQGRSKAGVFINQRKDKKLENSYHFDLLKLGFAKLDAKKTLPDYLKDLKEVQNKADKLGVGIWAENEATDYDEEEETDI